MNNQLMSRFFALLFGGVALAGCASLGGQEQSALDAIAIEKVHSTFIQVSNVTLSPDNGGFVVQGVVARHLPGHPTVNGHVHVEVLDDRQQLLSRTDVAPRKTGLTSRSAKFGVRFDADPGIVAMVRVTHHEDHPG